MVVMAKKLKEEEEELSYRARLFKLQSRGYIDEDPYLGHEESRGIYDHREIDVIYPTNPVTGFPRNDLGKITDPYLSKAEKEKVMSRLSSVHTGDFSYLPKDLSDDEILAIVPPRYVTYDAVDIQKWRDYLASDVLPYMSDVVSTVVEEEPKADEPKTE